MICKDKIDRVVEAREREESRLYREDGTRLYSEAARAKLEEAGGLKDYAYLRRRGAKDALGLYHWQTYGVAR